ncbi:uncharacterized protein LOC126898279 [Daktulosphaira vitifoliae]|uniref:uncharacterized protein LOC126898279 n=1 Tax=Daktulosphaira vitifoliae TaxID=58002 RepID=UPI0021A99064|nr:uncharacterized protein LOC126898279 [Daktulosphaira vitifoliae]
MASQKLLRNEIMYIRRKLANIDNDLTEVKNKLNTELEQDTLSRLTNMVEKQQTKVYIKRENKQVEKFKRLEGKIQNKEKPNHNSNKKTAVVNLTDKELTNNELIILEKGFNFSLVPKKIPKEDIISSIENSLYQLEDHEKEIIRQESCKILREAILPKQNYNKDELTALKNLRNDNNVIILRADKGNATVNMKTTGRRTV